MKVQEFKLSSSKLNLVLVLVLLPKYFVIIIVQQQQITVAPISMIWNVCL